MNRRLWTAALAVPVLSAASLAATLPAGAVSRAPAPASAGPGGYRTFGPMRAAPRVHLTSTHLPRPVRVRNAVFRSTNWSGYAAVIKTSVTISAVTADFTIPSVNCAKSTLGTSGTAYDSTWAGLDGFNDGTVEQEGVDAFCTSTTGAPTYYAWFEMFPNAPVAFTGVGPGDAISVTTAKSGRSWVLTLRDITTGGGFTTTQPCPRGSVCKDASAEVITEDPGSSTPVFDLADFGMVNQTAILLHASTGARGSIGPGRLWNSDEIVMADGSGKLMAVPGTLFAGQAFNVTWSRGS
jgi:Peptidase A4 family